MADLRDVPMVLAAFEVRFLADRQAGQLASAEAYAAAYPGFESAIRLAYAALLPEAPVELLPVDQALAASLADPYSPGQRIGPYRLASLLGRGGQGVVYLAEDTRLARHVAIKVLEHIGSDPSEVLRRFAREAAVASRLDHPGICPVYDTGTHGGLPYLVMRHVEGETLLRRLDAARNEHAGPLASARTASARAERTLVILTLVERIARSLHAAHEVGVVHRDVKPGNVIITAAGEPVVLDFGLARDARADEPTLTRSGQMLGTPAYMAPEQIDARLGQIDPRTDVWALGAMLFECLTLERPFRSPTAEGTTRAILHDPTPDPRQLCPGLPSEVRVILATALDKEPRRRYQTALDLAEDLARARRREPILARPPGAWLKLRRWAERNRTRAALALALALAVLGLAGTVGYLIARRPELEAGAAALRNEQLESQLGRAYSAAWEGDPAEAIALFRAVIAAEPESVEALVGLSFACERAEDLPQARDALAARPDIVARHPGLLRLSEILAGAPVVDGHEAEGLSDSAFDAFLAGLLVMRRSERRQHATVYTEAIVCFRRAILSSRVARPLYYHLLLQAAGLGTGHADTVRETSQALRTLWPDRASTWYWSGFAWADLEPAQSIACYRRSLELEPENPDAMARLAPQLAKHGDVKEALALAQAAAQRWPSRASSHQALAAVHEVRRDFARVIPAAREATRLRPNDWVSWTMLGSALLYRDAPEQAREALLRALQLQPAISEALALMAQIELALGDADAGMVWCRRALESSPAMGQAWWMLGSLLDVAGRHDEAHAAIARAIELGGGARWLPQDAGESVANLAARIQACERYLARCADEVPAAMVGAGAETDGPVAVQLADCAEAATFRGRHVLAARLWRLALEEDARASDPPPVSRATRAARAALLAGDTENRTRALEWLRAELAQWQAKVAGGGLPAARLAERIAGWREDPVLQPACAEVELAAAGTASGVESHR